MLTDTKRAQRRRIIAERLREHDDISEIDPDDYLLPEFDVEKMMSDLQKLSDDLLAFAAVEEAEITKEAAHIFVNHVGR